MQKEFFGVHSIKIVKDIIEEYNAKRVLLVTGDRSYITSGSKTKLDEILNNIYTERFYQFEVNPKLDDVFAGVEILKNTKFDIVIAVGGGSVIDMAKLINILAVQKEHMLIEYIKNSNLITENGLPLVAIPTTFGTGSEATHFSVVYVDNIKHSLAHHFILPEFSVVDAGLALNLPSQIAAASAMDALSQAIESYWAVKSTDDSKKYAKEAIKLIIPVIGDAVSGNRRAIDVMSKAANLAGKAINISTTTAPHAISYPLTSFFALQHGHAVALTLGYFFEINYYFKDSDVIDKRGVNYLKNIMEDLFLMFDVCSAIECKKKWYGLMETIGLNHNMRNIGISTEKDIAKITDNINHQRLSNNPVRISENSLSSIFKI